MLQCFAVCALFCATLILARPQQPNWNDLFAPTPNPPSRERPGRFRDALSPNVDDAELTVDDDTSSSTATPAVTTASPRYLACLASCPSTMEYNPVCGSDSINYHNGARLECARRCGQNVAAVRLGTCNAL